MRCELKALGGGMMKLARLAVVCALLWSTQLGAETLTLVCEGFAATAGGTTSESYPTGAHSFIFGREGATVQSSLGDFEITDWGSREIRFENRRLKPPGTHIGRLDRITGQAVTWMTREGQTTPTVTFIMDCKTASPKF